jgi:hypothetical protein
MFSVDDDGALRPVADCDAYGIDTARLWATIDFLGLNCTRLKNARRAIHEALDSALVAYLEAETGTDDENFNAALLRLAQDTAPPAVGDLTRFVTTIRAYFGRAYDYELFPRDDWSIQA